MDSLVFLAVLVAAACHAGWNATLKIGLDTFTATSLVIVLAGVQAVFLVPFVGLPSLHSAPWLIGSIIIHVAYFIGLTEAYRTGDMGQVYPIARGSAPLMTAGVSFFYLGESTGWRGWAGIALLTVGIILISTHGGRDLAKVDRRALGFAFFTAVTIFLYSICDGIGGRTSGNPVGYAVLLFVFDGISMFILYASRRGVSGVPAALVQWKVGFVGGLMSFISYGTVIWAMTKAPIAAVAALRETSVLFAALIAIVILKEPMRAARIAAAAMIVCGLVLIRLA
jgi:drug/metabolite transporter (DMT)-like permease